MPLDTLDEGAIPGCSEEKIIILTLNFYKSCRRMKGVIFLSPLLWHASKGGVCYLELTLVARSGSEDLGGSIFYLLRSRGDEGRSKYGTSLEELDAIFAFLSYIAEN